MIIRLRIFMRIYIKLPGMFLSFHKVIDEQQFLLYYFIELGMIHFVIFLLLCSCITE